MSRKPYECFKCLDNGFPNTMGLPSRQRRSGKTIQLEEDGTGHQHKYKYKGKERGQQSIQSTTSAATTITTDSAALKIINA